MLGDGVAQRRRRPVPGADSRDDVLDQVVLAEDEDVDVEDRAGLVGKVAVHPVGGGAKFLLRFAHGPAEARLLPGDVVGNVVGHRVEVGERRRQDDGADRHPGGPGQPLDEPDGTGRTRLAGRDGTAERRVAQGGRELRADGHQERDFVLREHPAPALLDHEHAHALAEVHERYREKAGKTAARPIPGRSGTSDARRVRDVDRLLARGDQPDDPFAGGHPDADRNPG